MNLRKIVLAFLMPLTLCAQAGPDYPVPESAAPPEVSRVLRERVNQFFQYHVGTVNRKAIDLVAEDTKDFYFSSGKIQFLGVTITGVDFSQDLKKAFVKLDTTRNWQVQQYITVATTPVVTSWKVEDGKWVFYLDVQNLDRTATPMGNSAPPTSLAPEPLTKPDGTLNIPKDFAEPARVAAQAQAILSLAGVDKDSVVFSSGKPGTDQVTFHNGFTGQVNLKLVGDAHYLGLKVELDKTTVDAGQDAHVRFAYEPPEGAPPGKLEYTFHLNLSPFNQEYPINLVVTSANR